MNNEKSYKSPGNLRIPENLSNFNYFPSHNGTYSHNESQATGILSGSTVNPSHQRNFDNGMTIISDLNVHSKPFIPQEEFAYHSTSNSGSSNVGNHYSRSNDASNSSNYHSTRPKMGNKFRGNKSNNYGHSYLSNGPRHYSRDSQNSNIHQYDTKYYHGNGKNCSNFYLKESFSGGDNSFNYTESRERGYPIGQGRYMSNGKRSYNTSSQYHKQNYNKLDQNAQNHHRSQDQSYQKGYQLGNVKFNYKQPRGKRYNSDKKSGNEQPGDLRNHTETNIFQQDSNESHSNENIIISHKLYIREDEKTQKEHMTEALMKGAYECMVCCEKVKQHQAIWSCTNCFNCFHLVCIKKWAGASKEESGWRCPACQNLTSKIPNGYFCFCKKMRDPEWNRREIPHSCGEVCGKKRAFEWCTHKCNVLCHPGPCPECYAYINRKCECGKNIKDVRCSNSEPYLCGQECLKILNCRDHFCDKKCHIGDCDSCSVVLEKTCYCGKENKSITCDEVSSSENSFCCNSVCGKILSCSTHECSQICHSGPCDTCPRAVENVTSCPCGKMPLKEYYDREMPNGVPERQSCLDPIPLCGEICGRVLECGTPGAYHACQKECHEGPCPPCPEKTAVLCRCGFVNRKILCVELKSKADEVTCDKQCKKLRQCGRHKCGQKCCIDVDHICTRVCNLNLSCRKHKCQELCHRGKCPRCLETSFEELTCHCGASITYPPVPCGTEPPACSLPCRRPKSCSHSVSHNCHADDNCPPCTVFCDKLCYGGHTVIAITPCYKTALSCGSQCGKPISCGLHICQRVCHEGPCIKKKSCTQKCSKKRPNCGHSCGVVCHTGACPRNPCKEIVTVTCICGNRKVDMTCAVNEKEFNTSEASKLVHELHGLRFSGSIDISEMLTPSAKNEKLKRLECDDDCALVNRNRQLALALQITNPDSRDSLGEGCGNLFSDSIKEDAKKNLDFAQTIHNTLTELVMKAKESKHRCRSHSFVPMNRDKRRFIREYAKYFGCESEAYDNEPNRNVVVTAQKASCRLPPISIVSQVKKEQGKRTVPGPVNKKLHANNESSSSQMKRLERDSSFESKKGVSGNSWSKQTTKDEKPVFDYFDLV